MATNNKFNPQDHMIKVSGKDYLPAAARIAWFRHENPTAAIITELLTVGDVSYVRATITRDGNILATAMKTVTAFVRSDKDFGLEKAETGAIGRAIAFCGYGILQAGDDVSEGDELADSPQNRQKQAATPRNGKGKGNQSQAKKQTHEPTGHPDDPTTPYEHTIVQVDYLQSDEDNDGQPFCRLILYNGEIAYLKDLDIIRALGVATGNWKPGDKIKDAGWFGVPYLKIVGDYMLATKIDPPKDWDALAEPEQAAGF